MAHGPEPLVLAEHGDRILDLDLDGGLEVVLVILADAGQVGNDLDAVALEMGGIADAGELQDLRRRKRP